MFTSLIAFQVIPRTRRSITNRSRLAAAPRRTWRTRTVWRCPTAVRCRACRWGTTCDGRTRRTSRNRAGSISGRVWRRGARGNAPRSFSSCCPSCWRWHSPSFQVRLTKRKVESIKGIVNPPKRLHVDIFYVTANLDQMRLVYNGAFNRQFINDIICVTEFHLLKRYDNPNNLTDKGSALSVSDSEQYLIKTGGIHRIMLNRCKNTQRAQSKHKM